MRISLFSQNLAGAKEVKFDLTDFIEKAPSENPEIYVEMSQEDGRKINGESLIETSILSKNNYSLLVQESLNGKSTASQNIITSIFVKNNLDVKILHIGHIPYKPQSNVFGGLKYIGSMIASSLKSGKGYTKGVVYIKISLRKKQLLFLNIHLPVNTRSKNGILNDHTLGLEYRRTVFENILNEIVKRELLDSKTTLIIGGDLNFRQDYYGMNQLNSLLEEKKYYKRILSRKLKELPFPHGFSKRLTCKFRNPLKHCRTKDMPNEGFTKNFIENIQNECGDEHRIPSRCDRFLILSDDKIDINYHKSLYIQRESDHNALLASIDITERPQRMDL